MIELLVAYIQSKGYPCEVRPHMLVIWKIVRVDGGSATRTPVDEIIRLDWRLASDELNYTYEHILYQAADYKLQELEDAIAARLSSPLTDV